MPLRHVPAEAVAAVAVSMEGVAAFMVVEDSEAADFTAEAFGAAARGWAEDALLEPARIFRAHTLGLHSGAAADPSAGLMSIADTPRA